MIAGFNEKGIVEARYTHNPFIDEPLSIQTSIRTYYYLFDGLGSVVGLTDYSGNLVSTYKYDAFGNIISETGDATLNALNPYRYTSRVYDKESGLYYYRARYYDSGVGRFTQKDPLRSELREGNNLYVYVGNNPVNWKDPMGTYSLKGFHWLWHWNQKIRLEFAIGQSLRFIKVNAMGLDENFMDTLYNKINKGTYERKGWSWSYCAYVTSSTSRIYISTSAFSLGLCGPLVEDTIIHEGIHQTSLSLNLDLTESQVQERTRKIIYGV